MQMASMNSHLFSAYLIILIGKSDSQEDTPFSIAPLISCCDSGVGSSTSSLHGYFGILRSSVVFSFSCFWYIAGLRGCVQD